MQWDEGCLRRENIYSLCLSLHMIFPDGIAAVLRASSLSVAFHCCYTDDSFTPVWSFIRIKRNILTIISFFFLWSIKYLLLPMRWPVQMFLWWCCCSWHGWRHGWRGLWPGPARWPSGSVRRRGPQTRLVRHGIGRRQGHSAHLSANDCVTPTSSSLHINVYDR